MMRIEFIIIILNNINKNINDKALSLKFLKKKIYRRLLSTSPPQFQKYFRFNNFFKCRNRVLKNFLLLL